METLTKENFWDDMEQKYPKAIVHFKAWIDRYKSEHNWDTLFNGNLTHEHTYAQSKGMIYNLTIAPKYHELPIAIQFGIFLEYTDSITEYPRLAIQDLFPTYTVGIAGLAKNLIECSLAIVEVLL